MSRRILAAAALLCALALAGCQSVAVPPPILGAAAPASKADAAVAKTSAELARYCGLTRAALAAVGLFASPKMQEAAAYASAVVGTVCAAPPSDVRGAIDTVGRAYSAVRAASAE